jgi:signal peptidase II
LKRQWLEALVLPVVAAAVLLVDQISKHLVATRLEVGQSWDIAPWLAPIFHITHVTNTGVAFGLFQNLGNIFIVAHMAAAVVIVVYYYRLPSGQWPLRVALGLSLGGDLGNLINRICQGYVVDFIDANFWPLKEFPVFNLADASISAGVALLAALMLWEESRERARKRAAESG